ncbi:GNAT family N-acetyltransferase [Persicobacter psychrovividus]|uniref:N-acetyltransferase domain-containing protein n=1 Tax=Persicobacter psychrovividus TaxID=387638 RepID=A0ABM7VJD4_9BACT|nr:hypothetical protein PEPS_33590 [Persicobacter psychrovividus]
MTKIQKAKVTDLEMLYPLFAELRPQYDLLHFKDLVKHQFKEGYQVMYILDGKKPVALVGFRTLHQLVSGKTLFIDDMVTAQKHRGKGYGKALMMWLQGFCFENNYDHMAVNASFEEVETHRFCLNNGLKIETIHFGRKVAELKDV